jgi:hypothetical protein
MSNQQTIKPRRNIQLPPRLEEFVVDIEPPSDDSDSEADENIDIDDVPYPIPYPFKTKIPHMNTLPHPVIPFYQDTKLTHLRKYRRPYFSPRFDSYEVDFFESGYFHAENEPSRVFYRFYLAFININSKFLIVYPHKINTGRNSHFAKKCLEDMITHKHIHIDNIRADDDFSFSGPFLEYLRNNNIKSFFSGSKFTIKNRVIDSAIRTIKDGVGENRELLLKPEYVLQIVDYYNTTPHTAYKNKFTPQDVQEDRELESWYIRRQSSRLLEIKRMQTQFMQYKRGNVLLIHLPLAKSNLAFRKRRRNFDELALFYDYSHGNVRCTLLNETLVKALKTAFITIPIYYTKFLCESVEHIPHNTRLYFNQK